MKLRPWGDSEKGKAGSMSCGGREAMALARCIAAISLSVIAASFSGTTCGNRQEEPFLQNPRA
jgi:hypothetical protein